MPAQASRPPIPVGNDPPVPDIEPRGQVTAIRAVFRPKARPVERHARLLAYQVRTKGLHEGPLHDQHVRAEDLSWRDLSVCVG